MVLRRYLSVGAFGGATTPWRHNTNEFGGASPSVRSGTATSAESKATAEPNASSSSCGTPAAEKSVKKRKSGEKPGAPPNATFAERHNALFMLLVFLLMLTTALQVFGWANFAASLKRSGKLQFLCEDASEGDGNKDNALRMLDADKVHAANSTVATSSTSVAGAIGISSAAAGSSVSVGADALAGVDDANHQADKKCSVKVETTLSKMFLTAFLCFVVTLLLTGRLLERLGVVRLLLLQIACFGVFCVVIAVFSSGGEANLTIPGVTRGRESVGMLYFACVLLGVGTNTYLPLMKAMRIAGKRSELKVASTNAFAELGCVFFYLLALIDTALSGSGQQDAAGNDRVDSAFGVVMLGLALYLFLIAVPLILLVIPDVSDFAAALERIQAQGGAEHPESADESSSNGSGAAGEEEIDATRVVDDGDKKTVSDVVIEIAEGNDNNADSSTSFKKQARSDKATSSKKSSQPQDKAPAGEEHFEKDVFSLDFPAFKLDNLKDVVLTSKRGRYFLLYVTVQASRLVVFTGTMDLQLDYLGQQNGEWTRMYGQVSLVGFFCYLIWGGVVQPFIFKSKYSVKQEVSFNLLEQRSFFPTLPNVYIGTFALNLCGVLFQFPLTFPHAVAGACNGLATLGVQSKDADAVEEACNVLNVQIVTFLFSVLFRVLLYSILCSYLLNYFGYTHFARNYSLIAFIMNLTGAGLSILASQLAISHGSFAVVNGVSLSFAVVCFGFDAFLYRNREEWRKI